MRGVRPLAAGESAGVGDVGPAAEREGRMTRITRVLRRIVRGRETDLVVELRPDGVSIHPKRTRRPDATVHVTWQWIYQQVIWARPPKKRRVRRGLLRA
jgi:hypothetical protein